MQVKWVQTDITELVGRTITEIIGLEKGDAQILFKTDQDKYGMAHMHECCEVVTVEEIAGDPEWLLNSPVTRASADCYDDAAGTSTFYRFSTVKGTVTIRWYGESMSGCYGETASLYRLENHWG